ncbi:hypothetical protein [Pararhodospirillum photometricum]|uniref:DUF3185 domain-containing protein n=1 Tax=Pararhodospirillum photometricum DSM 122 TaxID=1150469 RepID=H6SL16_PARPM|nr:hypothetical protein [Pararhodospirillum photometricum]CCG08681.1 unnamed protein product [Pararhodospirillum photometricum DSM 122]
MTTPQALILSGTLLSLLGIAGLAVPVFTTDRTENIAQVGDLKIQAEKRTAYEIPSFVAGGVLALGVILIGGSLFLRR